MKAWSASVRNAACLKCNSCLLELGGVGEKRQGFFHFPRTGNRKRWHTLLRCSATLRSSPGHFLCFTTDLETFLDERKYGRETEVESQRREACSRTCKHRVQKGGPGAAL